MAALTFPWLRPLWQQFLRAAAVGKIPHAIGMQYNQELGIDTLLDQLAAYLLCNEVGRKGEQAGLEPLKKACGQCKSCLLWQAGTHPDYLKIEPEAGKQIGVDAVRAIANKVQQSASQGGNKVVQILGADRMTPQAANALLKSLEEPPQNTYFQIAAMRYSQLLPTVRSRLLSYPVPQPTAAQITTWLQQHTGSEITDELLIQRAQTAPLTVLEQLKNGTNTTSMLAAACTGQLPVEKDLKVLQQQLKMLLIELQVAHRQALQGQVPAVLAANVRRLAALPALIPALEQAYRSALHILRSVQNAGVNPQILIAAWSLDFVRSLNAAVVEKVK